MPTARHKLNAAAVHGVLILAGIVALCVQSWSLFWLLAAILLATAIHSGDIRIRRPRR